MSNSVLYAYIGGAILVIAILSLVFFKKKRKEIGLSIASAFIAVGLCEVFLRLFLPQISDYTDMFEVDPYLGWKFVANKEGQIVYLGALKNTIRTNALGFRDEEPKRDKRKKILVLGDSFVSNISVEDDEVFTEIMEDSLQDFDVLNFGVNGYGQVQEYLLMEKWFDAIQPNVIVLIIYVQNDFTDNTGNYGIYFRPYACLEGSDSNLSIRPPAKVRPNAKPQGTSDLLWKSHLARLISRTKKNLFATPDSLIVPAEITSCRLRIDQDFELKFRIMEKLLLKIAAFGKDRNTPVVLALAPSIIQVEDHVWKSLLDEYHETEQNYSRSLPNERLMKFAEMNNIMMLDLFPILRKESKKNVKLYHAVEQHWTKEGNQVVAMSLMEYLNAKALIE